MKPTILLACLFTGLVGGCSWFPRAGPSASDVVEQARTRSDILFDVVEVDDRVVSTLLAQPSVSFAHRFATGVQPPELKIAVGDMVSVLIWESAAGGLFSEAPPQIPPGERGAVEPLVPETAPPVGERRESQRPRGASPGQLSLVEAATTGRRAAIIPEQQVGADGAISIPYAGRVPAAARSPADVQHAIEQRLADKALQPQALVIVTKSAANAVTVTGEVIAGGKVTLSPGGLRLLDVIAAAGGATAPVRDLFVQLSRNGVTATIPLQRLVSDPAENIYTQPGDALTLVRVPQTFSVFGAAGRNADLPFGADEISLAEALGKSQGLRDDLAKPQGVFLFRYERDSVVRALDQPIATRARGGYSPIVYRFNLREGKTYLLAQEFPIHDKDVIFVADAPAAQIYKFFNALNQVTGPVITGLVTCRYTKC